MRLALVDPFRRTCAFDCIGSGALLGGLRFRALCRRPCRWLRPYDFVPAPQTDLNRIYRIDRITGEVAPASTAYRKARSG